MLITLKSLKVYIVVFCKSFAKKLYVNYNEKCKKASQKGVISPDYLVLVFFAVGKSEMLFRVMQKRLLHV
tara:strand:- start:288 stop:497 length:210 start_codon:yes stop_codon:yes gene_type:complete